MKNENANIKLVGVMVYTAVALWFAFALFLSLQGKFAAGPAQPPVLLGLMVGLPLAAFTILYWASSAFRAFSRTLDLRVITGLNLSRLIGVDFLIAYAQGRLPALFAFPAGIGDFLIGLTAIPLVLAISRNTGPVRRRFVAWNIFGLIDLIVAVSMGIMNSPSSFGILAGTGPSTQIMSQFPRSLIPTFLVPAFMLLHLLALARRNEVSPGSNRQDQARISVTTWPNTSVSR